MKTVGNELLQKVSAVLQESGYNVTKIEEPGGKHKHSFLVGCKATAAVPDTFSANTVALLDNEQTKIEDLIDPVVLESKGTVEQVSVEVTPEKKEINATVLVRPKEVKSSEKPKKKASQVKVAFVTEYPGHKNSQGEDAPWCIKDHETDKVIRSFKSKEEAEQGLQDMHIFKDNATQAALEMRRRVTAISDVQPGDYLVHEMQEGTAGDSIGEDAITLDLVKVVECKRGGLRRPTIVVQSVYKEELTVVKQSDLNNDIYREVRLAAIQKDGVVSYGADLLWKMLKTQGVQRILSMNYVADGLDAQFIDKNGDEWAIHMKHVRQHDEAERGDIEEPQYGGAAMDEDDIWAAHASKIVTAEGNTRVVDPGKKKEKMPPSYKQVGEKTVEEKPDTDVAKKYQPAEELATDITGLQNKRNEVEAKVVELTAKLQQKKENLTKKLQDVQGQMTDIKDEEYVQAFQESAAEVDKRLTFLWTGLRKTLVKLKVGLMNLKGLVVSPYERDVKKAPSRADIEEACRVAKLTGQQMDALLTYLNTEVVRHEEGIYVLDKPASIKEAGFLDTIKQSWKKFTQWVKDVVTDVSGQTKEIEDNIDHMSELVGGGKVIVGKFVEEKE